MIAKVRSFIHSNPSRKRLETFLQHAAQSAPVGSLILDAGAGEGYYRHIFHGLRYQSTDLCKVEKAYGRVTYISDLASIPIADQVYDLAICTQVLEHIPDPQKILCEIFRVLKPGGQLWLSAPLFFPEHEVPFDFYRYTQFGLKHLLLTAGFAIQQIDWMEGYFATLAFECRTAARSLPLQPIAYGGIWPGVLGVPLALILKPLFFFLSLLFGQLETKAKFTQAGFCKNYTVIAVKPQPLVSIK